MHANGRHVSGQDARLRCLNALDYRQAQTNYSLTPSRLVAEVYMCRASVYHTYYAIVSIYKYIYI